MLMLHELQSVEASATLALDVDNKAIKAVQMLMLHELHYEVGISASLSNVSC